MATAVHHFGMTVADIDQTQEFYRRHFGFEGSDETVTIVDDWFAEGVAHEGAQVKIGWLRRDDAVIELHEYIQPDETRSLKADITDLGAAHIAFRVDDIDAVRQGLQDEGVRFYSAPVKVSAEGSAPQLAGVRWCYCEDPNGYIVELFCEPEAGVDWESKIY